MKPVVEISTFAEIYRSIGVSPKPPLPDVPLATHNYDVLIWASTYIIPQELYESVRKTIGSALEDLASKHSPPGEAQRFAPNSHTISIGDIRAIQRTGGANTRFADTKFGDYTLLVRSQRAAELTLDVLNALIESTRPWYLIMKVTRFGERPSYRNAQNS